MIESCYCYCWNIVTFGTLEHFCLFSLLQGTGTFLLTRDLRSWKNSQITDLNIGAPTTKASKTPVVSYWSGFHFYTGNFANSMGFFNFTSEEGINFVRNSKKEKGICNKLNIHNLLHFLFLENLIEQFCCLHRNFACMIIMTLMLRISRTMETCRSATWFSHLRHKDIKILFIALKVIQFCLIMVYHLGDVFMKLSWKLWEFTSLERSDISEHTVSII